MKIHGSRLMVLTIALLTVPIHARAQAERLSEDRCSGLRALRLRQTSFLVVEIQNGGGSGLRKRFNSENQIDSKYAGLPSFCRVVVEIHPSSDSKIRVEIWMPITGWNGKLRAQGDGGFGGEINSGALASSLKQGYVGAATDTGHTGSSIDAKWALGHPEKVKDFGYRAIHEMTVKSKLIIKEFYRMEVARSYFFGCSDGGREGLMEAERFPMDYDGILSGAPAYNWTHLFTNGLRNTQLAEYSHGGYIPAEKIRAISTAVLESCDAIDGVIDGVVSDPRRCVYDVSRLLCKEEEKDSCLTGPQLTTLEELYRGFYRNTGEKVFPGYVPGGEEGGAGWSSWITGSSYGRSLMATFSIGYFQNMVYEQQDGNYETVSPDDALQAAIRKTSSSLDASSFNLRRFKSRKGKLILYHGWSDPAVSPLNTIDYYDAAVAYNQHKSQDEFIRLFRVPGMQHCSGGSGADSFGQSAEIGIAMDEGLSQSIYWSLEQWVERGSVPEVIVASKYIAKGTNRTKSFTRLLCAFPKSALYGGSGDVNDSRNYSCVRGDK